MVDFQKVRQSDFWYVVGYIATDGYLSVDGRHINITSKDRAHLYSIRKALQLKNKIGRKTRSIEKNKKYSQLQFGDINFFSYLENLGLTSKKSLTLGPINVKDGYFADFLRGVVDGDGSISTWIHRTNNHRQWSLRIFSASSSFIRWLESTIGEGFQVKGKLYTRNEASKKNPIFILKYGKFAASKILKEIYYPNCLALERKLLKAQLCLQS